MIIMKHTSCLFAVFAAGFALLSCQNDEKFGVSSKLSEAEFTATTESYDESTRTALNSNGNVVWKKGDQVTIFTGGTVNDKYQVLDASEGKTSATISKVNSSSFVVGNEIDDNVAVYPYNEATGIEADGDAYSISMNLPEAQSYAANSFGNGAFPMVAVTDGVDDKSLTFKNLLGGLKLQLKGTCKVQTITLTGNAGELLYGPATVTAQSGKAPTTQLTGSTQKTVTPNCGGVQLNSSTATTFIIAVPAGALSSGFSLKITDTEGGVMEKSTSSANTIVRSKLTVMPVFMVETTGSSNYHNGHEYVDLGLSVKWATMNVGATSETGYGDYFAWGATEPLYESGYAQEAPQSHWKTGKSGGYSWVNTPYQTANTTDCYSTKWTKYVGSTTSSWKDASATDANALKTVLDASDDAATANWGGSWRMPTKAELDELSNSDNCTWTWYSSGNTEFNGIAGYKVTSKKSGYAGNYIFLPAAGYRGDTYLGNVGSYGNYWSSSLNASGPGSAYSLYFGSGLVYWYGSRDNGLSVRPVCH